MAQLCVELEIRRDEIHSCANAVKVVLIREGAALTVGNVFNLLKVSLQRPSSDPNGEELRMLCGAIYYYIFDVASEDVESAELLENDFVTLLTESNYLPVFVEDVFEVNTLDLIAWSEQFRQRIGKCSVYDAVQQVRIQAEVVGEFQEDELMREQQHETLYAYAYAYTTVRRIMETAHHKDVGIDVLRRITKFLSIANIRVELYTDGVRVQ
jgi:hypothetical protein